eukprot:108269_1
MCFSFKASVFAGSLAYLAVILCWIRNGTYRDRWHSIWILLLGSMQWYDAYFWYLHDNGHDLNQCTFDNWLVTLMAFVTIMLEPIGNLAGYMYSTKHFLGYTILIIYFVLFMVIPVSGKMFFGVQYDALCGHNHWWTDLCGTVTNTKHILYGSGRSSDGGFKCWNKYYFFGEMQDEIPLILRVMFLLGIIYPYRYSKPFLSGVINSFIICVSWFLGYIYPPSHASVWCFAASFQSIYVLLLDPYLFPQKAKISDETHKKHH